MQHRLILKWHDHIDHHLKGLSAEEKRRRHEAVYWVEQHVPEFDWRQSTLTENQEKQPRHTRASLHLPPVTLPKPHARKEPPRVGILTDETLNYLRAEASWLKSQEVEYAIVFLLDAKGNTVGVLRSQGHLKECAFDVLAIANEAAKTGAAAIIAMHNHPHHQAAQPSELDEEGTQQLREGLSGFNVVLQDHLIIAKTGHVYSFQESTLPPLTDWDRRQARLEQRGF